RRGRVRRSPAPPADTRPTARCLGGRTGSRTGRRRRGDRRTRRATSPSTTPLRRSTGSQRQRGCRTPGHTGRRRSSGTSAAGMRSSPLRPIRRGQLIAESSPIAGGFRGRLGVRRGSKYVARRGPPGAGRVCAGAQPELVYCLEGPYVGQIGLDGREIADILEERSLDDAGSPTPCRSSTRAATSAGCVPGNARVTLRRPARREVVSRESVLLLPASTSPNAGRARVPLRPSVTGEASTERPTQSRVAPPALEPATRGLRIRV